MEKAVRCMLGTFLQHQETLQDASCHCESTTMTMIGPSSVKLVLDITEFSIMICQIEVNLLNIKITNIWLSFTV